MSVVERTFEERLEEELATMDPEMLRALIEQIFQEEPEKLVELEEEVAATDPALLLQKKQLLPTTYQPRPPPRQRKERKERKMQELLRRYDPYPPQNIQTVTDYQNEILDLFDDARHEGEESKGQRYIRWRFIRVWKKTSHQTLWKKFEKT